MLTNYVVQKFPVNDIKKIEQVALELMVAQRNGDHLTNEQIDWLDYANNILLACERTY